MHAIRNHRCLTFAAGRHQEREDRPRLPVEQSVLRAEKGVKLVPYGDWEKRTKREFREG